MKKTETKKVVAEVIAIQANSYRLRDEDAYVLADMVIEAQELIAELRKDGQTVIVRGGGYGYQPINAALTKWRATDGSEFSASLAGLILEYLDTTFPNVEPSEIITGIPKRRRVNQERWEGSLIGGNL